MSETIPRRSTSTTGALSVVVAALVLSTPAHIYRCWVAQKLWSWFVTPTFGVHKPSVAMLYGLTWVVGLLWPLPYVDPNAERDIAHYLQLIFTIVWTTSMGWLIGVIAHGIAS